MLPAARQRRRLWCGPFLLFLVSCSSVVEDVAVLPQPEQHSIFDSLPGSDTGKIAPAPEVIKSALAPGYQKFTLDTAQVSQYIRCIFQDSGGSLWLGTVGDGICRYDQKTLRYYTMREGLAGNSIQAILEDHAGNLWVATNSGLCRLSLRGTPAGTATFATIDPDNDLLAGGVWSLLLDRDGILWAGCEAGVCRASLAGNTSVSELSFTDFPLPGPARPLQVRRMMQDRSGHLWFTTAGAGVYRYDGAALRNISVKDGLGSNNVHDILQQKNGIIWLATVGGGLCRLDPFAHLNPGTQWVISYKEDKGSNEVWRLFLDNSGMLWVCTRGEIRQHDVSAFAREGARNYRKFTADAGVLNTNIQSIFQDRVGHLWFGSGGGLLLFRDTGFVNVKKKGPWPSRI